MLKSWIVRKLDGTKVLACYTLATFGFLADVGWFRSWREKRPVDALGRPIPWVTYPFLEFLEPRLQRDFRVFEYGCGNSTLWFAAHVRQVVSCEHDARWHAEVQRLVPDNVELHLESLDPAGRYAGLACQFSEPFDLIFIDGRDRVACLMVAPAALTQSGVIVLDNSDRPEYEVGARHVLSRGFRRLDFFGPGPITTHRWCTSLFYRPENCLGV